MSGTTFERQQEVRKTVNDYLEKYGMTSLRRIAAYVEKKTGILPTTNTIGRLVRSAGYELAKTTWEKR